MILELFKPNQYVKSFKDVDLIDLKEINEKQADMI